MIRTPLFALGLAILTGCGATVPLGSGDSSGGSGNSPGIGGASTTVATGGSSSSLGIGGSSSTVATGGATGGTDAGVYVCSTAPHVQFIDPWTNQMGDHCDDIDSCGPGPGRCTTGGPLLDPSDPSRQGNSAMACIDHHVQLVTAVPINWSANVAAADAGTSWSDCNSALAQGSVPSAAALDRVIADLS